MPINVFNVGLNEFARKYLVVGKEPLSSQEERLFKVRFNEKVAEFIEQLLLFETLTLKVYGENIPLTVLINTFGLRGVEELLECNGLKFMLWSNEIVYTKTHIPHIIPISTMGYSSSVHSDPEASITSGLEWLKNKPSKLAIKALIRKAVNSYILPDNSLTEKAKNATIQHYSENRLVDFGLNSKTDIMELDENKRKVLGVICNSMHETFVMGNYDLSIFNAEDHFLLALDSFNQIMQAQIAYKKFYEISKIEKVNSIKELLLNGKISIKQALKLRSNPASLKFRDWLADNLNTAKSREEIINAYVNSLVKPSGFFRTTSARILKPVSLTILSTYIGSNFANPNIGLGIGISLSIFDEFILNKMTAGWTPKLFMTKIIKEIEKK